MVPLCLGNRVSFVLRSVRCVVRSAGCVVRSRILATCYSLLATCLVSMCLLAGVAWAEYTGGSYDGYSSDTSSDADIGGQAVLISSRANQAFMVAPAASQEISPILITDVEGAGITAEDATGDIRIRIPADFNMTWDTSDTTAALGGNAAGKCFASVSFEDSDMTLRVNVSSDFGAGENVVISGLSFTGFSAASSIDHLGLDIYNGDYDYVVDDKAIQIILTSDVLCAGGYADGYDSSTSGDYKFGNNLLIEGLKIEGIKME